MKTGGRPGFVEESWVEDQQTTQESVVVAGPFGPGWIIKAKETRHVDHAVRWFSVLTRHPRGDLDRVDSRGDAFGPDPAVEIGDGE